MSKHAKAKMSQQKPPTDWFGELQATPDRWQEAKPKLSDSEISKAAEIYKSFVDPASQGPLYHVMRRKCHKDTFNKWWTLAAAHNKSPVDHGYSIDQYILDKKLGPDECPNAPSCCGVCPK